MPFVRKLLFPFSVLYGCVVWIRNYLYDNGILKSKSFSTPVICVGNLSTGGTGKTPHVEFCIETLSKEFNVAVLSRGYGRQTKGFLQVTSSLTSADCGDEPLQMFLKYPDVFFYVGENRAEAIEKIISTQNPDVILMDDGLQHRAVRPSFKIVLTAFDDLFLDNALLPAGNLREQKSRITSSNLIVVTKTPLNTLEADIIQVKHRIEFFLKKNCRRILQPVLFSGYECNSLFQMQNVSNKMNFYALKNFHVVTFAGLAKPLQFQQLVSNAAAGTTHISFSDHYQFTVNDLQKLKETFEKITATQKIIITTEKDAARIREERLAEVIASLPVFVLPVAVKFIQDSNQFIKELLINHVRENKNNSQVH